MFSRAVDVVVADLSAIEIDEGVLSVAELRHSLDIAMSDDLPEYLAAHTWLRGRLADYFEIPPGEVELVASEQGKPVVVGPTTDLEFNLAYTNWMAILAVAFRHPVGVDIRSLQGVQLEPGELERSLALVELQRYDEALNPMRTFQKFMARKEALAKATGVGVPEDLRQWDMSGLSPVAMGDHVITDINLGDDFVAALASAPGLTINLTIDTTTDTSKLPIVAAAV